MQMQGGPQCPMRAGVRNLYKIIIDSLPIDQRQPVTPINTI